MPDTEEKRSKEDKNLYIETLGPIERARYSEKLKLIDGKDPYELKNLSADVNLLPAVTYPDIVNFLVYSPSPYTLDDLKSYKGLEAYNQFVCGWVSAVSTVIIQNKHVVKARVLHSQRLREKPLSPWIVAEKNGQILSSHCDCMAGLGESCTHVAALLFAIDGTVKIRESRTVTQEPAYWLLPTSLKSVSYSETRSIDFSAAKTLKRRFDQRTNAVQEVATPAKKTKFKPPAPSEGELNTFFANLARTGGKPAILSVVAEHSDKYVPATARMKLPKPLTDLKDKVCVTGSYEDLLEKCSSITVHVSDEEAKNVEICTKKQSECKEWFQFRAGRITASKMKSACHTDPANPSHSLIKSICYPAGSKFTNAATKWGIVNEAVARTKLLSVLKDIEMHENLQLEESGLHISLENPYIAASPDGIISCDCCGRGCIEVKCPFSLKGKYISNECSFLKQSEDGELRLDRKHSYFYQVQTQMGVTKTEFSYFVVWTEVDFHLELILFEQDFFEEICKKSSDLFYKAILPELVGKYFTRLPGSGIQTSNIEQPPKILPPVSLTDQCNKDNLNSKQDDGEERWCYCDQVESGKMICCDNENCMIVWFHFTCLNLTQKPKSKTWYCPECKKLPEFSKKKKPT